MSSIIMSEEFLAKAKAVNSFEELKALVSAEGVEVADTELMDTWERISESTGKGKFKLTEEELDNVAGGCGDDRLDIFGFPMVKSTEMRPCGWKGDIVCGNCKYFEKKDCGYKDYDGICKIDEWK